MLRNLLLDLIHLFLAVPSFDESNLRPIEFRSFPPKSLVFICPWESNRDDRNQTYTCHECSNRSHPAGRQGLTGSHRDPGHAEVAIEWHRNGGHRVFGGG
jgi:hypothetical protein